MALLSGFFQSNGGDRIYRSDFFASYFASFVGNGVFANPSSNLQVIAGTGLNITVSQGKGWINGYYLVNDGPYALTLTQADGVLSRIDRVVMALNFDTREIEVYVKTGTPSGTPTAPALQRDTNLYELALADIRVNAGTTSVVQGNITDTRLNTQLCGVVTGIIQQVDTTTLFIQYQEQFEEFLERLEAALDGDVAGNLLNLINDLDSRLTASQNDFEYQIPTINSNVIMLEKNSNTNRLFFRLNSDVSGNIRISLNQGTTSLPLQDVQGQQVTFIERGFAEVVQGDTFFTLRNRGLSNNDLIALITAANEVEANSNTLRQRYLTSVNELGLNLPNTASWNDILVNLPNILTLTMQVNSGTFNIPASQPTQQFLINGNGNSTYLKAVTVNNIGFNPKVILFLNERTIYIKGQIINGFEYFGGSGALLRVDGSLAYVNNDSFRLPVHSFNSASSTGNIEWIAIG